MDAGVVLIDPKYPHNVGGVLRACAAFGVPQLWWTGARVGDDRRLSGSTAHIGKKTWRLPREERHRAYAHVEWGVDELALDRLTDAGLVPVCVEVLPTAEPLVDFEHPERAVYVFGPEDGGVPKGVRHVCHRFVTIPCDGCLNLAAAVNVVLYDRLAKTRALALA